MSKKESEDCSICFETPTDEVKISCGHIYCRKCLKTWSEKNKTCPLCRKVFSDVELVTFSGWLRENPIQVSEGGVVCPSHDFLYWERLRIFR